VVAEVVADDVRVAVRVVVGDDVAVVVGDVVGVLRWHPEKEPSANDSIARFNTPTIRVQSLPTLTASPIVQDSSAATVPREYLATAVSRAEAVAAQSFLFSSVTSPATAVPHATWPFFWWHFVIILFTVSTCTLHFCIEGNVRYVIP